MKFGEAWERELDVFVMMLEEDEVELLENRKYIMVFGCVVVEYCVEWKCFLGVGFGVFSAYVDWLCVDDDVEG